MIRPLRLSLLLCCAILPAAAFSKPPADAQKAALKKEPPDSPLRMQLTRVQILLDRAGFRPGKIDGLGGEFTQKAADRYSTANGLRQGALLDVSGIANPYREYTVADEDMRWIGPQASSPAAQEKLKAMLYGDLWELVAERFHCDREFLHELNNSIPEDKIAVGSVLLVPDVSEFRMADVVALEKKRREEAAAKKAAASATPDPSASPTPEASHSPAPARHIILLRRERLIEVWEGDRIVACFPCTPGSAKTPVPLGNWHIIGNILMPSFRWDKSVLESGVRSDTAFELPPGPNNPVGIVWMGLNRPSVGMHGTPNPDQIGRNESHGCIRLANWDAFLLTQLVKTGTAVEVRD
ncbi:MAG: L,D-transpeptidase family protein [Verrucomicrobiota bacterium]